MIAGPAGGECEIREAGVGDAVALARLLGELKSNPHSPEQIATQLVASPDRDRVLVAEAATEVVGFARVRIGHGLWEGAPKAELAELYVRPAWRRRGVGRALVGRCQALAWAAGATTLGVSIRLTNDAAQDFFRAIGFEQRRLTLDLLAPRQSEAVAQSAARRVLVVGGPGSGKTTLARRIGDLLGVPVLDLDLVAFELGLDSGESLRARLHRAAELASEESWVAEGVYTVWTKALIQRADLVVWLDVPWRIAAWRIVLRHVRAELAGNNRFSGWMKLVRFVWWGVRYYYLWRDPFATPGGPPGGEEISWAATLRNLLPARDRLVVCRRSAEVSALLCRLADGRPAESLASDEPARPDSNQRRGGVSGDGAGAAADS